MRKKSGLRSCTVTYQGNMTARYSRMPGIHRVPLPFHGDKNENNDSGKGRGDWALSQCSECQKKIKGSKIEAPALTTLVLVLVPCVPGKQTNAEGCGERHIGRGSACKTDHASAAGGN